MLCEAREVRIERVRENGGGGQGRRWGEEGRDREGERQRWGLRGRGGRRGKRGEEGQDDRREGGVITGCNWSCARAPWK